MEWFSSEMAFFARAGASGWIVAASLALLGMAVAFGVRSTLRAGRLKQRLTAACSELTELRQHDPLTGLSTRAEFEALLESEVGRADMRHGPLALLYVALDSFGAINEAYGLRVGDGLLIEAAQRLSAFADRGTTGARAARAAGGEFTVLLPLDLAGAMGAAGRLQQALSAPFTVE